MSLKKINYMLWLLSIILTGIIMGFVLSHSLILGPWFTWFVTEPGKIDLLYKTYSEFREIHPPILYNSFFTVQFFILTLFFISSLLRKYRTGFSLAAFIFSLLVGVIHYGSGFGKIEKLVLSGVARDPDSISKYASMNVPIHILHFIGLFIAFVFLCMYFKKDDSIVEKRINKTTSRTAEWTCLCRAISFAEKQEKLKSDDFIAPRLLPTGLFSFIKIGFLQSLFRNKLTPKGLYEYVVARTKYVDNVFESAEADGFKQILIMGAGFDTRGLRLLKENSDVTVFELDVPITQQNKLKQYKKRKIDSPPWIKYIPIDFSKDSLEDKLLGYSFDFQKKTLFMLEGLIMYLNLQDISQTFSIIRKNSGLNSRLVFDYVYDSVVEQKNEYYGEEEAYKRVNDAGEKWTFGVRKGEIDCFLRNYNFKLMQEMDSKSLKDKYFKDLDTKINETHSIILAEII